MNALDRLAIHTITCKPWPVETAIAKFAAAGVKGLTTWRQSVEGRDLAALRRQIEDAGLAMVSHCRGGFFPAGDSEGRRKAVDDNRRCLDEAAALGAPLVVLVCGAVPRQPLAVSRDQIEAGIAAILPHAESLGIRLGIEPLHPMYAADRSAVNTMRQANDLCDRLRHPLVGVAVDVYHLWWDDALEAEIQRCGRAGRLFAFHVCDWVSPLADMLNDRGLMGEGCIDIPEIRGWVEAAGFSGFNEVEIFSNRHWARDQDEFLADIVRAYQNHV